MAKALYAIDSLSGIPTTLYGAETLALFDIDGTLVTPKHRIMRRQNEEAKRGFVKRVQENGSAAAISAMRRGNESILIEMDAPEIIKGMTCRSLAFTARRTGHQTSTSLSQEDMTVSMMSRLGFKFSSAINQQILSGPYPPEQLMYHKKREYHQPGAALIHQSIIFSNNVDKGVVLEVYLRQLMNQDMLPERIIMVDDTFDNLASISESIEKFNREQQKNLSYEAYWYRGTDLLDNTPYEMMLDLQEMYLVDCQKFIDDEEALDLLYQSPSHNQISEEAFEAEVADILTQDLVLGRGVEGKRRRSSPRSYR